MQDIGTAQRWQISKRAAMQMLLLMTINSECAQGFIQSASQTVKALSSPESLVAS